MNDLLVTCYERFKQNLGSFPLIKILNGIKTGRWSRPVKALRDARAANDSVKAEQIKKSLPAFTLSATYKDARRKENLLHYNGIVILDIDKLDTDEVDPALWRASDCPYTVFAFRSPGGCGVKIGVNPVMPANAPLTELALTVENHKAIFEACKLHYEQLLAVDIDPSGKDPGRLCFVSDDPDMYISPLFYGEAVIPVEKQMPTEPSKTTEIAAEWKTLFRQIRKKVTRVMKYTDGNRNNYVFRFALHCCKEGIPMDETLSYCKTNFTGLPTDEIIHTLQSAYKSDGEMPASKAGKTPKRQKGVLALQDELSVNYAFRYNVVTRQLEFRPKKPGKTYETLTRKAENTLWCELLNKGINCQMKTFQALLRSDFVPDFNPFLSYFDNLPAWDGQTDYIMQVAETIQTTNQEWWHECFRRWIVALVACATIPEVENHTVLMFDGEQGTGKTRWCLNLVPPQLHTYRHSGPANPRSKDIRIGLSECILINLDELHALNEQELNQMKEMITAGVIRERRPYAENAEQHGRVASFTSSIDSTQVLTDINGSRRFLCFRVKKIDYLTPIDYTGLYSQALALLRSDFKYWFDRDDIERLNANNEDFRVHYPEEEFFYTYYRKPRPGDTVVSYLTAAQIMHVLCQKTYLHVTPRGTKLLASILKKSGFEQLRRNNRRLFAVVPLTDDEIRAEKEGRYLRNEE